MVLCLDDNSLLQTDATLLAGLLILLTLLTTLNAPKYVPRATPPAQCAALRFSGNRSGPVLMKPLESSTIQRLSQRVFGSAPVMMTCRYAIGLALKKILTITHHLRKNLDHLETTFPSNRHISSPRSQLVSQEQLDWLSHNI
jgi:hypothetical protein